MPGWRADSRPARKRGITLLLALSVWAAIAATPARAATSVSFTFDDGDATQYAVKAPLASHGMHATFYVNSAKVGTSGFYMTWSQVNALAADGNEIGGHTLTHPNLATLSDAQRRTEICNDRQNLVARGFDPVSFAYPFGGGDASVQAIVSECGYKSGRRVGGVVSPNWCPACGSPRAESIPPANALHTRTPSFGTGEITLAAIQNVITQAELSGGGWIQLVFHGVCDTGCGEGSVRPSTFAALLDWLAPRAAHGTFVRTVRDVIEHQPPNTSIGSKPDATTGATSATFTFSSSPAGAAFECSLDGATFAPCTTPASYTGLGDGQHTFQVRARDAAGAVDATPASWTWTVDATPPDTSLASGGPSGTVGSASASFAFSSTESGTFECKLDSGGWVSCTSPKGYSSLGEGSHTFSVRAVDAVGNTDATPASRTWTVDTVPPDTSITAGPSGTVASASTSFEFAAPGAVSFECKLDAGPWGACTSPRDLSGLGQGSHTFSARGTDAAGNVDATPASRTWAVDTVAPDTSISGGPTGTVATDSASFLLSSTEPGALECRLDSGDWESCSPPKAYSGLRDGSHTFSVRGIDAVGNVDGSPASRTWTVDTTPPETSITAGPSGTVASAAASFEVSAPSAVSLECKLDAGAWESCSSPKAYGALADGDHTFSVRGTDSVGNTDPSPATRTWTVDTSSPETAIDTGPSGTVASASASFTFDAVPPAVSFECKLDGEDWAACTSPVTYTGLADGAHSFSVRSADAVGNIDPTPASRTWTVDTTAPDSSITSGPADTVETGAAAFAFTATEAGSFECRVDTGAWEACGSPKSYTDLANGSHTFAVRATDPYGNVEGSPATRSWTVAIPPPPMPDSPLPRDQPAEPPTPLPLEQPPAVEPPSPADGGDHWARRYLDRLLRKAARATKRKKLPAFVRGRRLNVELPGSDPGRLQITLSLLPSKPGPAVRLARARVEAAANLRWLKLRLGRKARKRLRPLYVAAFELSATFEAPGGEVVHSRRVFKLRR